MARIHKDFVNFDNILAQAGIRPKQRQARLLGISHFHKSVTQVQLTILGTQVACSNTQSLTAETAEVAFYIYHLSCVSLPSAIGPPVGSLSDVDSASLDSLIPYILSNEFSSYHFVFFVVLPKIFSALSASSAVKSLSLFAADFQLETADLSENPTFSLDTLMKNTPMITSTARVRKWSKIA